MVTLFLIAWVLAGVTGIGNIQGAPSAEPVPSPERRMFDMRSSEAWPIVQKRLGELGLIPDKTDRANQVVLTRLQEISAKGLHWLPMPRTFQTFASKKVRFLVFVSPFAEPARVSVGSIVEATGTKGSTNRSLVYNPSALNQALMDEITKAVGKDGVAIPDDFEQRRQLALTLLKDDAGACLGKTLPSTPAALAQTRERLTPPRLIPISKIEVLYPIAAVDAQAGGVVRIEQTIFEDGGLSRISLPNPALGRQLEAAAAGPASLRLFTPTRVGACAVPTTMTLSVNYAFR